MDQMGQHVIFDLDDTLVHCNVHFLRARQAFVERMLLLFADTGVSGEEIWRRQGEIDLYQVQREGLGKDRFPRSLVAAYRELCRRFDRTADPEEEKRLLLLGYQVYQSPVELYPGAREVLEELRDRGYQLYLYTGGDEEIQIQKLVQAGIDRYFAPDRRFVTPFKDRIRLRQLLELHRIPESKSWMVGNSLRNDILPALQLGLQAIHVPEAQTWEFDHAVIPEDYRSRWRSVSDLREVPRVIVSCGAEEERVWRNRPAIGPVVGKDFV